MEFLMGAVKTSEFQDQLRTWKGGRNKRKSHEIKAFRPYFQANKKCI